MELLILLIPFITSLFLLIFYRKETVWFEYLIIIVPSIASYFLIRTIIVSVETQSTEYLGAYATRITHYDEWDEWIHRTCTRRIRTGTINGKAVYRTETYDCSYREYHPEKWEITDNSGATFYITEKEYKYLSKLWNTPQKFIDMNRDYYRIDGDAQYYEWDNNVNTIRNITYPRKYENKVKVSKSIFNFEEISQEDIVRYGLYDYPNVSDDFRQNCVVGYQGGDEKGIKHLNYINSIYGDKYQFRCFLLFFYNKDIISSEKQKSYWFGGNKNEFTICVGIDSLSNKIQWCNAFSWMDSPTLEIYTEQYINSKEYLNIDSLCIFLEKNVPSKWKRKEFKDFDYLKIELSTTQYTWLLIFIIILNILISIFVVKNDIKN